MARQTMGVWVCDNCGHRVTMPGMITPVGWYELTGYKVTMQLCSLNCLNEVAQAWVQNSIPVGRDEHGG